MDRRIEYMPLATIDAAARNPKRHDRGGIRTSIDRFGLGEVPLIDERTGRLVAGHGRLEDIYDRRRSGQEPPDGVRVDDTGDWLVPVIRGWQSRSDAEAEAYLVASNKLTISGGWDDEALGEMLTNLADQDLLGLTGFTDAELDKLINKDLPDEGDADEDKAGMAWGVIVVCRDEAQQVEVLSRLSKDGYEVRALMTG